MFPSEILGFTNEKCFFVSDIGLLNFFDFDYYDRISVIDLTMCGQKNEVTGLEEVWAVNLTTRLSKGYDGYDDGVNIPMTGIGSTLENCETY